MRRLQKYLSVDNTAAVIQHGRSYVYDLLGEGKLEAVKDGKRTYVLIDSIERYQASILAQPVAKFAPPSPRKGPLSYQPIRRRRRRKAGAS
jgi:hypothetical protein